MQGGRLSAARLLHLQALIIGEVGIIYACSIFKYLYSVSLCRSCCGLFYLFVEGGESEFLLDAQLAPKFLSEAILSLEFLK